MKNEEIIPRSIEGDWDWREISSNQSKGWTVILKRPEREHIWGFTGKENMISTERNGEREWIRYVVRYHYDPDKLRLTLDGYQLDNKGEPETRVQEHYRVEFVSPTEMYLYDLEDVEPGEAESLRLMLHKL